jgi:hypothetical protein
VVSGVGFGSIWCGDPCGDQAGKRGQAHLLVYISLFTAASCECWACLHQEFMAPATPHKIDPPLWTVHFALGLDFRWWAGAFALRLAAFVVSPFG